MINRVFLYSDSILKAFFETNFMVFTAMGVCLVASFPLGILLFSFRKEYLCRNGFFYQILSVTLNMLRSVPFLIFIFLLIPVSRFLFGTSFGNQAATFPLTLVATSLYSRFIEQALLNVPERISERAVSMGATKPQIIRYFLLPSIKADAVLSFTTVTISTLSYSTVMGVIGAGGLGEFAFRYGYQEYDYPLMYAVVLIFILYVTLIQNLGYFIAKKINQS